MSTRPFKSRDPVRTRRRILQVAEQRFATDGFAASSMRTIAADADIQAATVYHYFPNKEELLAAVFRDFYEELTKFYEAFAAELPSDIELRQALRAFHGAHREFVRRRRQFAQLFFVEGVRPGSPHQRQLHQANAESRRALVQLAERWPKLDTARVLSLFMAIVAVNSFFETADTYLDTIVGPCVNRHDQMACLDTLISGADLETSNVLKGDS